MTIERSHLHHEDAPIEQRFIATANLAKRTTSAFGGLRLFAPGCAQNPQRMALATNGQVKSRSMGNK